MAVSSISPVSLWDGSAKEADLDAPMYGDVTTDLAIVGGGFTGLSTALHAAELGLDCRYCHNTVEVASHAAVPPAATCMNCHNNVKADSPKLALILSLIHI